MRTQDFNYGLNPDKIAQNPLSPRDSSKLLYVDRLTGEYKDLIFFQIDQLLDENDVLVFNETKVIKARLKGYTVLKDGRKKDVEIVLLSQKDDKVWECAVFPGERLKPGKIVHFFSGDDTETTLEGIIKEMTYSGRIIEFNIGGDGFFKEIDKIGAIPLPPYIETKDQTPDQYNTIIARVEGSAAAPTAGLHFTEDLLKRLEKKGIKTEKILLHIGLGTFKTITAENLEDHEIHHEFIQISKETSERLNHYRSSGKRIVAVGTTVVRTLESMADANGNLGYGEKETNIFIYPGYRFRFVDSMITNFHLPQSSLLMLVSAFYDRERVLELYEHALKEDYRFFSFGDAMFLR